VPKIDYPYFDAERGAYETASVPPLSVDVATASLASVDSAPVSRLGIRRAMRDEEPPPVSSRSWYWCTPRGGTGACGNATARRQGAGRTERRSALRRIKTVKSKKDRLTARELRKLYLEAVAERVPATIGATQREVFARAPSPRRRNSGNR
jgi:hypothetical protein